ncbi:MAG: TPM domain-containing protein, partial [Vitreoscilla sp.]|nr:TPM domain-containing protein [Vitreoscilla sp.]
TANMLSDSERAQLNQQLEEYAKSKGSQIAVLTVNTTAPEDTFTYGMRVVERWQLGRAKEDDGVLLLIAKDDRKNQILVGRGLEGVITDVDSYRILSENVRPAFQQGDYAAGITAAIDKLQGLVAGEKLPEPPESIEDMGAVGMAVLVPLAFLTGLLKRICGSFWGGVIGSALAAGVCLFVGTGFLVALAVAVVVLIFSPMIGGPRMLYRGGGGGGGRGGGGFGGGSSSGGGFSGGGGSFSGGGASGDW